MFCTSCGALVDDGLSFCSQCGSPLNQNAATQAQANFQPMEDHPTELFSNGDAYLPTESYAPANNVYQNAEPVYNQAPPAYQPAPTYNQTPPAYQAAPAYNQYANTPVYNQPAYDYASQDSFKDEEQPDKGNGFGKTALTMGILGVTPLGIIIVFPLLAFIFGLVGLITSKRSGHTNGKAIAGLVMGIISLGIWLFFLLLIFGDMFYLF